MICTKNSHRQLMLTSNLMLKTLILEYLKGLLLI